MRGAGWGLLVVVWSLSVYMFIPLMFTTVMVLVLPVGAGLTVAHGVYCMMLEKRRLAGWVQRGLVMGTMALLVGALEILVLILLITSAK